MNEQNNPNVKITDEMRRAAVSAYEDMAQVTRPENHEKCLNAALSAALAVATPADPHHDPRPWQDCIREDIREGDLVERRFLDAVYVGVAHHQDEDGDWWTEKDWRITYGDQWTLRRIPALVPPAEEVEPPTEFGAVIRDVEVEGGNMGTRMVCDGGGYCIAGRRFLMRQITAFTLPDGTRARRDGEHEDGTPRFVKVREGEK